MTPVAYLVLGNPSTKNNLGTLIRCAAAFAVEEVVVVGATKWSTHGAHGSHKHVRYRCFDDWESAAAFLKNEKNCDLCGIVGQTPSRNAIPPRGRGVPQGKLGPADAAATAAGATAGDALGDMDGIGGSAMSTCSTSYSAGKMQPVCRYSPGDSERSELKSPANTSSSEGEGGKEGGRGRDLHADVSARGKGKKRGDADDQILSSTPVRRRPFRRSTAFLVGHQNRLGDDALDVCDFLVHVEQQAIEPPSELGAPVTTSIALHHFTAWANYEERQFTGEKFNVDREAARCRPPVQKDNPLAEERLRLREERRAADPLGAPSAGTSEADGRTGFGWLAGVGDDDTTGEGDY
ncbi:unnamed protein product [Hapterophycus canaliculatus]